jgi:thymidine kinase
MFFSLMKKGLQLITGPMFCGKTEELIRRINREKVAEKNYQVFKIFGDNRYDKDGLVNNDGLKIPATDVKDTFDLKRLLKRNVNVIGIDEILFFDEEIINFCIKEREKYRIIATGFNLDYKGRAAVFKDSQHHIGELMPYAENINLTSICTHRRWYGRRCGKEARYTKRLIKSDKQILIGGPKAYGARCWEHFGNSN